MSDSWVFLHRLPLPAQKAAKDKLVSSLNVRAICSHSDDEINTFYQGTLKSSQSSQVCGVFRDFALVCAQRLFLHAPEDTCHSEVNAPGSLHAIKTLKQKNKEASESRFKEHIVSKFGQQARSAYRVRHK